ncbi:MAG TPA: cytochrome c peroxidase [Steroidobacteraceae bacterium]|nr:cytochrome c peroxidase [Steroidobacteraceae bacterium]
MNRTSFSPWCAAFITGTALSFSVGTHASPTLVSEQTGLPIGSELDEDSVTNPREIFHSESIRGRRSYMSNLGNLAFNSPYTLGEAARKARMSCATCHVNGASNPKLFIPGLSARPGTFDTTNAFFNPKTDNGVLDPVTIPSLRGARYLGPYGHDGRSASLRDFVRNVVVNEFAGAEPSAQILDAIVAYIEDIDFLPNPNLDKLGRLGPSATLQQQRGEALFVKPFPHAPALSCAACHTPSAAFVDHLQHDIGSGGLFKTPTLLNADFSAPYFHDGRFSTYDQVIDYFDHAFELGLNAQDHADLAAYLAAIGDGVRPDYHLTGGNVLGDINSFASVLDMAIPRHDVDVVGLATQTAGDLLQDLADHYPEPRGGNSVGAQERTLARATLATLMKILQRIQTDVAAGHYSEAAGEYLNYRKLSFASAPAALQAADPSSLFAQ